MMSYALTISIDDAVIGLARREIDALRHLQVRRRQGECVLMVGDVHGIRDDAAPERSVMTAFAWGLRIDCAVRHACACRL